MDARCPSNQNHSPIACRALFISDSHLGFRFSRADDLLSFLMSYQPDQLYLVGDFLDGWRLNKNWYWLDSYTRIVNRILQLAGQGTRVFYAPGNHDDFLREPIPSVAGIAIADQFIHEAADGRRFLVIHGDQFDTVEKNFHFVSRVGSQCYDVLTWTNYFTNQLFHSIRVPNLNYCFWFKRLSKGIVGAASGFKQLLTQQAEMMSCQAVICGHIHRPQICADGQIIYCNTGDWVEHRSALVEDYAGNFQLIDAGRTISRLEALEKQQTPVEPLEPVG